jgi:HK97 family phage major capsid protein
MPSPIAQRITDAQERITTLQDQLTEHLATVDDTNVTDEQLTTTQEINHRIEQTQKSLETLRQAEQRLAQTSEPANGGGGQSSLTIRNPRPFAAVAEKVKPSDHVWRSLVVQLKTHCDRNKRPAYEILRETYGEDEQTKAVFDVVTRAATVPADTVTSGWASQLVNTSIGEFFDALMPMSVYPGLAAKGGNFTFGRNGVISLPTRLTTPTVAGSFFGQGAAIPVRQGAFSAVTMTPKKMGVISTFTREIAEHSTPSIEQLLRQAIQEDTGVAIDTVLLDANAATLIRPAGLRQGVAALTATPSPATGFGALVADIKQLVGALITGTSGNVRSPVWITNPIQALAISLTQNAGGDFPFKMEVSQGQLQGYPLIVSTNVPAGTIFLIDAADFFTATGTEPRFDVSDQAVLHMEDTTPGAITLTGSTVNFPVRSLWQTDSIGIRMLLDINWVLRRTGVVAYITTGIQW